MCEQILDALASGRPLSGEERAHLDTCPGCAGLVGALEHPPRAVPGHLALVPPAPERLHALLRRRAARRGGFVLGLTAAAGLAVYVYTQEAAAPLDTPPDPDLIAALAPLDGFTTSPPPGVEVAALLASTPDAWAEDDPFRLDPLSPFAGQGDP